MIKVLRILGLYVCLWFVFFLVGIPFSTQSFDVYLVSVFFGPVVLIWINERRISKKIKKSASDAAAEKTRQETETVEWFAQIEADKIAIRAQVEKHLPALSRNMKKAVKVNDYGAAVLDERTTVVLEFLASTEIELQQMSIMHASSYITGLLEAETSVRLEDTQFDPRSIPSNGYEFETWVAEGLERFGWQARVTQGSGDQGVDVIAERNGVSVGLQCKLYSNAVGNKAVQEIYAGAKHMGLDKAAVLTNAEFTRSAKELADSTGVLLLSPEDIPELNKRLQN